MNDPTYIYSGPVFDNIWINPVPYRAEYLPLQLELESKEFYELRKSNGIKPYRIVEVSEKEKSEITEFFESNKETFFFLFREQVFIGSILYFGNYIQCLVVDS